MPYFALGPGRAVVLPASAASPVPLTRWWEYRGAYATTTVEVLLPLLPSPSAIAALLTTGTPCHYHTFRFTSGGVFCLRARAFHPVLALPYGGGTSRIHGLPARAIHAAHASWRVGRRPLRPFLFYASRWCAPLVVLTLARFPALMACWNWYRPPHACCFAAIIRVRVLWMCYICAVLAHRATAHRAISSCWRLLIHGALPYLRLPPLLCHGSEWKSGTG